MEEVLFSPDLVRPALNVAMATMAVGLVAMTIERFSRWAALPLRHGMLCVAVMLILASPLPLGMAALLNLGLWPIDLPSAESFEPEELSLANPVTVPPTNGSTDLETRPTRTEIVATPQPVEFVTALDPDSGPIDNPPFEEPWLPKTLSMAGSLFLLAWGILGVWFGGRLLHGLIVVRRLRRSLRPSIDPRLIEAARQVFAAAGMRAPARIAESLLAPAPLTLGWWRAVIVIPDGLATELNDDQLSCMLAHEAAHVRRRDTLIGLMQQLAATLFWWNPFLHGVNRRINRLRERLCDDCAASHPGRGVALAQALVRVAEWSAARVVPSPMTNGLLEDFSDLEERIHRLQQTDRLLSTRCNWRSLAALGGFGLLLGSLLLLPILRADEGEWFAVPELAFLTDDEMIVFEPRDYRELDQLAFDFSVRLVQPAPISFSGHVRTTEREPLSGARVYLLSLLRRDNDCCAFEATEPLAVTQTDAEGRYEFRDIALPMMEDTEPNQPPQRSGMFQVCAEMDGFGIAWNRERYYAPVPRPANFPEDEGALVCFQGEPIEQDLTLRPARPLSGRILDDRDQPVANATIQLGDLDYLDTEGHEDSQNERVFGASLRLMPARFHQAQTGPDGRFEILGLPDRSVVHLEIEHPDFAKQWLLAAITDTPITKNRYVFGSIHTFDANDHDKPVTYPSWRTRSVRTSPLELRVRATRPVLIDVVHDHDGTPARNVRVAAGTVIVGSNSEALSSGETDEHGRLALKLPPGKYQVLLNPQRASDDLETKRELIVDDRPDEQTFRFPLRKGCRLTVEVVDAATGKGIPGVIVTRNPEERLSFLPRTPMTLTTNDQGVCHAIVTPGPQRYGIEIAEGYPNIPANAKAVECEAGKTAQVRFRLRK